MQTKHLQQSASHKPRCLALWLHKWGTNCVSLHLWTAWMGRSLPRQHQSPCQCMVSALLLYTSLLQVSSHPRCAQPIHWRFARYCETRQRCGRPHQLTNSKGVQTTHCRIWNTCHVSGWFSYFYHTKYTFLQRVFIHFYHSKQGQQPNVQYCRLHQKIAPQKKYHQ